MMTEPIPTGSIPVQRAADGPAIAHPSWCRPAECATWPDTADELLVAHRAVLLDEETPHGLVVVSVDRGDIVCAHGGELLATEPPAVRVLGVGHDTRITPAQAGRLAAAVGRAAEIAAS
jgi:hypothetical protein